MSWGRAQCALCLCIVLCLLVVAVRVRTRTLLRERLERHRANLFLEAERDALRAEIRRLERRGALEERLGALLARGRD